MNDPEFSVLPGDADIDAFLEGSTDEPGEDLKVVEIMEDIEAL